MIVFLPYPFVVVATLRLHFDFFIDQFISTLSYSNFSLIVYVPLTNFTFVVAAVVFASLIPSVQSELPISLVVIGFLLRRPHSVICRRTDSLISLMLYSVLSLNVLCFYSFVLFLFFFLFV